MSLGKTKKLELRSPSIAGGVEVVYTIDQFEAEKWLRAHITDCSAKAVGFDIEWEPQFVSKKNGGTENETAVLQLGVDKSCLVLHIFHMNTLPKSLEMILKDRRILKVGSGIKRDAEKLERDRGLVLNGLADNQLIAKKLDPAIRKTGMEALADRYLGIKLDKRGWASDWELFPLQAQEIAYASLDAWVGLKIFQEMERQAEQLINGESLTTKEQYEGDVYKVRYDQETKPKTLDKCRQCIITLFTCCLVAALLIVYFVPVASRK